MITLLKETVLEITAKIYDYSSSHPQRHFPLIGNETFGFFSMVAVTEQYLIIQDSPNTEQYESILAILLPTSDSSYYATFLEEEE